MSGFQPYFTNDGSVGLYSTDYNDIYHSASGAVTEAYEKFIYPINWNTLLQYEDIKILDICYGIGYNTKSFLNYIFENKKKLLKIKKEIKNKTHKKNYLNNNIDAIHTNNIFKLKAYNYTETTYTNKIFNSITVTALDNDKLLTGLSPFIKTGVKVFKNNIDIINKLKLDKYFETKCGKYYKINNSINYQILSQIYAKNPKILQNNDLLTTLNDKSNSKFFSANIRGVFNNLYTNSSFNPLSSNLHNIYYRYLTNSYKNAFKFSNINSLDFSIKLNDARLSIKEDTNTYNLIFLDAFAPKKCPCLWSYDFFKELYNHLSDDGMLLTYSSAAQVRSAMISAGFSIGKIFIKRLNKFQGTIAVKNTDLIKYSLSEADLGLLKTRAGIFYHDPDLAASNEAILLAHKSEVENSELISCSQYYKSRRNNGL